MNFRAFNEILKACPKLAYKGHYEGIALFAFDLDRHPSVAIEMVEGMVCRVLIAEFLDDEDDTVGRMIGRVTVYQKMDPIRFNKEVDKIASFLNSSRAEELDRGNILSCL